MLRATIITAVLVLAGTIEAAAQIQASLQLPFAGQMPSRIATWRDNEALVRILLQNMGTSSYNGLLLSIELLKDGRRIAYTRNGHPAQPRFELGPAQTRLFSWREAIDERALEYDRELERQIITTGELPAGEYQLCVQVLDAQLRPVNPSPVCASLTIPLADPPQLISPVACTNLPSTIVSFQWTPSSPPAQGLLYRLTVKPRYRGQTPAQAMASNPVRLQVELSTTLYTTTIAEANILGVDATDPNYDGHVWQVQALLNGQPYGRNRGLSTIECFKVPPMAIDPVKPPHGAVVWDIPYMALADSDVELTCDLPANSSDTLDMIVRVHIPQQLSGNMLHYYIGGYYVYGDPRDTQEVKGTYRGGYFVYRDSRDTQKVSGYVGGYFVYRDPRDTQEMNRYRDGFYVYGDSRDMQARYVGGYFVYQDSKDTHHIQRKGWSRPGYNYVIGRYQHTSRETPIWVGSLNFVYRDRDGDGHYEYAGYTAKWGSKISVMKDLLPILEQTVRKRGSSSKGESDTISNDGVVPLTVTSGNTVVTGLFIPTEILLTNCPIMVSLTEESPQPVSGIVEELDEEARVIHYSWRAIRNGRNKVRIVVANDCSVLYGSGTPPLKDK